MPPDDLWKKRFATAHAFFTWGGQVLSARSGGHKGRREFTLSAPSLPFRHRPSVLIAGALALLLTLPAGAQLREALGGKSAQVVVLFVDLTESVKSADVDRIYTPTLRAVVGALKPGDRFVLSEISEQTLGSFAPFMDIAFPSTGRSMEDNDALEDGQRKIRDQWRKLLARRGKSRATVIMDSLSAGGQILARDTRAIKRIVILSDMIEESKAANFSKAAPATDPIIQQRREHGLLPDLKSVQVFVAGASAPTPERYMEIQNFWLKFVRAAGGAISEKTYGRVALPALE